MFIKFLPLISMSYHTLISGTSLVIKSIQEFFTPMKIQYLINYFSPPPSYSKFFSKTVAKGRDKHSNKLVFQSSWLETCWWLVYSPCQARKRPLVTAPFQKLEKATGKDKALERHQKMQCHQRALDTGVAQIQSSQKPKKTLPFKNFHAKPRDV